MMTYDDLGHTEYALTPQVQLCGRSGGKPMVARLGLGGGQCLTGPAA